MISTRTIVFILLISLAGCLVINAQDTTTQPQSQTSANAQAPLTDEQQKAKDAADKKAYALLDQAVDQVSLLRLPENRIRIQLAAGDMLWDHNQSRARSLFSQAADGVAEMMRNTDNNSQRWAAQLRQEVVLTAAQHDAQLAYQLLALTRSQNPAPADTAGNNFRRNFPAPDANLEQNLLARVAAVDPKVAVQKAEESLAKGQYPSTLGQVLTQLQSTDKDAAAKLTDRVVSKLQSENMLSDMEAESLALNLLRAGPRTAQTSTATSSASPPAASPNANPNGAPVLSESSFQDLANTVVTAAMRATPQPQTQRGPNGRGGRGAFAAQATADQSTPTDGQIEQQNARRLLNGLQAILPQLDQYLPSQATQVRNKMTEVGMGNNPRVQFNQINTLMQQGTTDSLLAAAATMPPQLQSRVYQQAAQKALDSGNVDQARQIATDHLDTTTRDAVMQKIDFQVMAQKVDAQNMDQLRQTLANLRSDDERIDLLLQLAGMTQQTDSKQAAKFLSEAQRLTNRRMTNYKQFDQQLRVAQAFATVDPARSFDTIEPGIAQLNELLSAAALLSGFEVNIFKDGELPIEGGSDLGTMVAEYGQQLAALAKSDFERAQTMANRFQLAEPRILAQLSIARNVLGVPQTAPANNGFNPFGGRGGGFGRRGGQD